MSVAGGTLLSRYGVTVLSLLEHGCLGEAIVIAGQKGLDRKVVAVTVLSTPDPYFLGGGELALTAGYAFRGDPGKVRETISMLVDKKVAAFGFKSGRYMPELNHDIITFANEACFPLIMLSKDITWATVIDRIYSVLSGRGLETDDISANKSFRERTTELLRFVLQKRHSLDEIVAYSERLRTEILPGYNLYVLQIKEPWCVANLRQLMGAIPDHKGCAFVQDGYVVIVTYVRTQKQPAADILKEANSLIEIVKRSGLDRTLPMACPRSAVAVEYLAEAFVQAKAALSSHKSLNCNSQSLIRYDPNGAFGLLLSVVEITQIRRFCTELIGKLLEYDRQHDSGLTVTLRTYLETNRSIGECARLLHLHPSTVKYRLKRAFETLGIDPKDFRNHFEVYLALKAWELSAKPDSNTLDSDSSRSTPTRS